MQVRAEDVVAGGDLDVLHPLYLRAMAPLLTRAAARHVLSRAEFDEEMADPRILKLVVRDDDAVPVGLTTLTRDVAAVPWVNASYFWTRFPDAVSRDAMFYLGYTFVDPSRRRSQALVLMSIEVNKRLADARGVIAYDICAYNDSHGVGRLTRKIFERAQTISRMDTQTYYAADYRTEAEREHPGQARALPEPALSTTSLTERPELLPELRRLLDQLWPAALRRPGSDLLLNVALTRGSGRQVLLLDENGSLRAAGLSLLLHGTSATGDVPDGWDDAMVWSTRPGPGSRPETVILPLVPPNTPGSREATRSVLGELVATARTDGASRVLAVVRPHRKRAYPLIPLPDYLSWRTEHKEPMDPELRTHLALGGTVIGTSEPETLAGRAEWERRLNQPLPSDGAYVPEGGAAPLVLTEGTGRYRDPQVWVEHRT